jgi:serine O-acetyltransferase
MFDNISADYRTYQHLMSAALWVMAVYRYGRWVETIRFKPVRIICDKVYWFLYNMVSTFTTVHLPRRVTLGKVFHIIHAGSIVIHPKTVFGDHVGIMHEVTVGSRGTYGAPRIGNNVFIGVGAKILGEITIGDNVDIGANAVVLKDVPPNSLVVGIPGRIIPNHKKKEWEYTPDAEA